MYQVSIKITNQEHNKADDTFQPPSGQHPTGFRMLLLEGLESGALRPGPSSTNRVFVEGGAHTDVFASVPPQDNPN